MKNIIFFSTPATGHIVSVLPIIQKICQNKNYTVTIFCSNAFTKYFENLNVKLCIYPIDLDIYKLNDMTSNFYNLAKSLSKLNENMYYKLIGQIKNIKPDLIIYDSMCSFAKCLSFKLNIKSICFITTFAYNGFVYFFNGLFFRDIPMIFKNFNNIIDIIKNQKKFRSENGLPKFKLIDLFVNECKTNIVFTPKEFQPCQKTFNKSYHFVGTTIKDRLPNKFSSDKKYDLYISLGTIFTKNSSVINDLINYLKTTNIKTIMSVGSLYDKLGEYTNIEFKNYVNQLDIINSSNIFINHGGTNSVYESIYFNKYQLCIPQQSEQKLTSKIVQKKKIGKIINTKKLNLKNIKINNKYLDKYANIFRKYDATTKVVNLINDYINKQE